MGRLEWESPSPNHRHRRRTGVGPRSDRARARSGAAQAAPRSLPRGGRQSGAAMGAPLGWGGQSWKESPPMGAEDTQEVLTSGPEFAKQWRSLMEQQAHRGADNPVASSRVVAL